MTVVASWDFANRRIYMDAAVWHPYDVYTEYRAYRRATEAARQYAPLLRMEGRVSKGGGKFTPRYMVMLDGTKIVPVDGSVEPITDITGELFSNDQSDFIDISGLAVAPRINYAPSEAEIIEREAGSGVTAQDKIDIAAAILAAAQATPIASDVKKVNAVAITGAGTTLDPWGPA